MSDDLRYHWSAGKKREEEKKRKRGEEQDLDFHEGHIVAFGVGQDRSTIGVFRCTIYDDLAVQFDLTAREKIRLKEFLTKDKSHILPTSYL